MHWSSHVVENEVEREDPQVPEDVSVYWWKCRIKPETVTIPSTKYDRQGMDHLKKDGLWFV